MTRDQYFCLECVSDGCEHVVEARFRNGEAPGSPPANPKQAYGDAKIPVHRVPPALELYAAMSLGEGATKYGPFNWRENPVELMTYVGAIKRHLAAWIDGEDIDPDSKEGKPHLAGIAGSLAIIIDALECGNAIDNRPPTNAGTHKRLMQGAVLKQ